MFQKKFFLEHVEKYGLLLTFCMKMFLILLMMMLLVMRGLVSYLSEADCLLAGSLIASAHWIVNELSESESMTQLIAASVAARGVLFGNSHVSSSRWHTIRSPRVWQIDQSFRSIKDQILRERYDCLCTFGSHNQSHNLNHLRDGSVSPLNEMPRSNSLHHNVEGGSSLIDRFGAEGSSSEEDEDAKEW